MKIEDPIDIEILKWLAQGMVEKVIAQKLGLKMREVKWRIRKMMLATNCNKSTRLVAIAYETGIITIAA